jgi:hypothetical protein
MIRLLLCILFSFSTLQKNSFAQKKQQKIKLTGIVTDYKNNPIEGALIFIDSIKTNKKTNKKGKYSIKVTKNNKLISIFSTNHGLIDIPYKGNKVVNFIFPDNLEKMSETAILALGYTIKKFGRDESDYSTFTDIYQLLRTKFQNLEIVESQDIIRVRGTMRDSSGNLSTPLFIVNGSFVSSISSISPTDIESITIGRGNNSMYGSRGASGVIKIKLKGSAPKK